MSTQRSNRIIKCASKFILMLLVAISFASCEKKIESKAALIKYINNPDNGLKKTDSIAKIKAELLFEPWQLIAMRTVGQKNKTDRLTDNIKSKFFFGLSLSSGNKELLRQLPFNQYSEMVQVLAFRMSAFIEIIPDDNKPVDPDDCFFQQTFGMSDANQLLIIFDKTKLQATKQLNIRIKEFGLNIGDLNFKISKKDIDNIPPIAIK